MSLREEQCNKVCRILDDVLANRPTERDSLIVATRNAFSALSESHWIPCSERLPDKEGEYLTTNDAGGVKNIEVDTLLHYEDGEPFWFYSQNPIAWRELPIPFGEE